VPAQLRRRHPAEVAAATVEPDPSDAEDEVLTLLAERDPAAGDTIVAAALADLA
jgi:hypothetical protein